MITKTGRVRIALLSVCSAALWFQSACESDALAPTSDYEGSECLQTGQCGDDKFVLDAGAGVTDPPDSGSTNSGPDSGVNTSPDSGGVLTPDAGDVSQPDSGIPVPPSVF